MSAHKRFRVAVCSFFLCSLRNFNVIDVSEVMIQLVRARRILILRKFRHRLHDISLHDVRKEGYETLADYKKAWEEINGEGS